VKVRSRHILRLVCLPLIVAVGSCAKDSPAQPSAPTAPTTPTPAPTPQIVLSTPTPVAPVNGVTTSGWPTLTVADAVRSGPSAALVYRFDIATTAAFNPILVTGTVSETPNQTSFMPPSSTPAPPQVALFWRAVAIDPFNIVASPATAPQSFTYSSPPSQATVLAAQQGLVLWPGVQPPGTTGHAVMGGGWGVGTPISFTGVTFVSPQLDQLQIFDLLDRGLDPQAAINWMHNNGYSTSADYYPAVSVIGFQYSYLALISGQWAVVIKAGA
jgi:hypothetical protein